VLHLNGLGGRGFGEKVTGWDARILKRLEGLPGGWTWFAGHSLSGRAGVYDSNRVGIFDRQGYEGQAEESCQLNETIITYWYSRSTVILSGLDGE
jgi:hypothetical protein